MRHLVGYYRYKGQQALEALEKLYKLWCLYDNAKTPYRRCTRK